MQESRRPRTSSRSANFVPTSGTHANNRFAISQSDGYDQNVDTCSIPVPNVSKDERVFPQDGSSYAEVFIKHSSSPSSFGSPSSGNSNTDQTLASTPSVTAPLSSSQHNNQPIMSSMSSSSSSAVLLGLEGVRKKNAKIPIPEERNIETIERLIRECDNDEELKVLRAQKRLLTNRQAALRSRQARKQRMEDLERQNHELFVAIQQQQQHSSDAWKQRCHQLRSQNEKMSKVIAQLHSENADLRSRLGYASTLTPQDTPMTTASVVSYVDYANNGHPMYPSASSHSSSSHIHDLTMPMEDLMLNRTSYAAAYGTINPQHITSPESGCHLPHGVADMADPTANDY